MVTSKRPFIVFIVLLFLLQALLAYAQNSLTIIETILPQDDSCIFALDGTCDEPQNCAWGTDSSDCSLPNSCPYAFDGECDEPNLCKEGTDTADCQNVDRSCPYTNDGECDEPIIGTGVCFTGTDRADCEGAVVDLDLANSCPYAFDGECDEAEGTGLCAQGTDSADCQNALALASITLGQSQASAGERITIHYSSTSGNAKDWIGLYTDTAGDRDFISWQYLSGEQQGSLEFNLPETPGRYHFRMFADDGFAWLATSQALDVRDTPSVQREDAPQLAGTWLVNFNGFTGTMKVMPEGSGWQAQLELGSGLESLRDVQFDGLHLSFTRPLGANTQHYQGQYQQTDQGATLSGSFTQDSTAGQSYSWSAQSTQIVEQPEDRVDPAESESQSLVVNSTQAASLHYAGVTLDVPAGAVPLADDGSIGEAVFSIESSPASPVLPTAFEAAGGVYQLGPEGQALEQAVRLTLPVAEHLDIARIYGIATLDNIEGRWLMLPGIVDTERRTVSIWIDHFSPFLPIGWRVDESQNRTDGGWLELNNDHNDRERYVCAEDDQACRGMQAKHVYGVCLLSWDLEQPSLQFWGNRDSMSRTANAADGESIEWWLPNGTYVVEEYFHISEYGNQDPLYVPRHQMYVKTPRQLVIQNGTVIALGADYPQGYVEGWSSCHGGSGAGSERESRRIYLTGDVQATLTWQGPVDVDLYITDPSGETIFFNNPSSASGGQLDRDNTCDDSVQGGPENIAWPRNSAPAGEYLISVDYYGYCGESETAPSVPWTVRVIVAGAASTYQGSLGPGEMQEVLRFTNVRTQVGQDPGDSSLTSISQDPNDEACWASYSDDPRSFATQPGGVFPHTTLYEAGNYLVHVGPSGDGMPKKPQAWRSYGPYAIALDHNYAALITSAGTLSWMEDSAQLAAYSRYPDQATIYAANDNLMAWYSICIQKLP